MDLELGQRVQQAQLGQEMQKETAFVHSRQVSAASVDHWGARAQTVRLAKVAGSPRAILRSKEAA